MGKSLGAYLSDNALFLFQGIQRQQRSVEMVEHRRKGRGTLEQLVSGSGKTIWNV